jgi:hypothetical protein
VLLFERVSLSMLRERKPYDHWNIPEQLLVRLLNTHGFEYSKIEIIFKASKFVLDSPPFRSQPEFQVPISHHSMMFDYFKINVYRYVRRHQRVGYGVVYLRELPMDNQLNHTIPIKNKGGQKVADLDFEIKGLWQADQNQAEKSCHDSRIIEKKRSNSLPNLGRSLSYQNQGKEEFLANLSDLLSVFRKHGFPYSNFDLIKGLALLSSYYKEFPPLRTQNYVHDTELHVELHGLFKYCLVCYGTAGLVLFGQARLLNLVQRNKAATITFLNIKKNHMLEWNYVQNLNSLYSKKPCFYVVYDEQRNALVVAIRGTFSLHDIMTDLSGEYVPFMNGFAHSGFLQAALWIRDHYFDKLREWMEVYSAKSIFIVGHSLGAAIGSILLVLIRDAMKNHELDFECMAFLYATPPSMSFEVSEPFMPYMYSCINEHDPVPFASYGSFLDFKDLLAFAIQQLKLSKTTAERLSRLHEYSLKLKQENKHLRLVVPGQILAMYKTKGNHYIEYCTWQYFDLLHFKLDMGIHHLPNYYEKSLKKSMRHM